MPTDPTPTPDAVDFERPLADDEAWQMRLKHDSWRWSDLTRNRTDAERAHRLGDHVRRVRLVPVRDGAPSEGVRAVDDSELHATGNGRMRMDAYYYTFRETGVVEVDRILSAVAHAGKSYHHTDMWMEGGCVEMVQRWANHAAEVFAALRSRVPAEATSGAVTPGPFTRAIREQALNLIDECVAVHGEEAAQSRGHERGCWFLRYADALTTLCEDEEDRLAALRTPPAPLPREGATKPEPFSAEVRGWTTHDSPLSVRYHGEALDLLTLFIEASPLPLNGGPARRTTVRRRDLLAALRTPPAPLPREGAMRTEIESAMRELLDIRMDDLRCPVGITDEAFAGAALGAWKRIRYAMEHLTVALTPAAQPTTKTEK